MTEGPAATSNALTQTAKATAEEFGDVLVDYGVPILGIVVGFAVGTKVGGVFLVGNFINDVVNTKNDASMYSTVNIIAGLIVAGIYGAVGACFYGLRRGKGDGKSPGHLMRTGIFNFLAFLFWGLALSALVQGVTNNPAQGALETAAGKAEGAIQGAA